MHSQQEAPVDAVSDKFQNLESETQPQEENIPTEPPPNSPNQEMRQSSQRITAKQADERRKDCMFELEQYCIKLWLTMSGQWGEDVVN